MIVDCHMHIFERMMGYPPELWGTPLDLGRAALHGLTDVRREGQATPTLRPSPYLWDGVQPHARIVQRIPPCPGTTAFPAEVALAYMDWIGVDKAFLVQGPAYGRQNRYYADAVYQWPERFVGFAEVDWYRGNRAAEHLERWIVYEGLRGCKVEVPCLKAAYPRFAVLSDNEMRVWETCERLRIPVLFHLEHGTKPCEEIRVLLEEFPKLVMILAHLGAPRENAAWRDQCLLAKHERVYLDLAALPFAFREEEYPYPGAQECIRWAVSQVGAEKIMWGSDVPTLLMWCTYEQMLNLVRTQCGFLSEEQRRLILGGTAERLMASLPS